MKIRLPANRWGFSIIELLLTISIIAILATSTTPVYTNFLARNHLENKTNEVISSLQTAKTNSISGKEDSQWGVNLSTQIVLFKGTSYVGRDTSFDQTYDIPASVSISPTQEVIFNQLTGDPEAATTITISNNQNESNTITLNEIGTINVN